MHANTFVAVPGMQVSGNTLDARVYPNPAHGVFNMDLYLPESGYTVISLYNSAGQSVGQLKKSFMLKGEQTIVVPARQMAKGNYYVRIQNKNHVKVVPLILQ
jgi:hypothetical protein